MFWPLLNYGTRETNLIFAKLNEHFAEYINYSIFAVKK